MVNSDMNPPDRLKTLEKIFSEGAQDATLSTETLLDIFLVLYDECSSSSLRRDKNIAEFVETGKALFVSEGRHVIDALEFVFIDTI